MKEKTRLMIMVSVLAILGGWLCYIAVQPKNYCSCEMAKNRECKP